MSGWKAGPEKPRTPYCWDCGRKLHGRVHATVIGYDGRLHDVHKDCVNGHQVVGGSTTVKPRSLFPEPRGISTEGGVKTNFEIPNDPGSRGSANGCPLALPDDPIGWCSVHNCYVDRCPP